MNSLPNSARLRNQRGVHMIATDVTTTTNRIPAIDFTRGALVLFMVLYHWLNYFIAPQGDFYRYIRFVTPSFIFVAGFLVSNVYLSKYDISDLRLPARLMQRGLKILGVFIFLNVVIGFLFQQSYSGKIAFGRLSITNLVAVYVTGNTAVADGKVAAFYVLVPISYLLLFSAGLLMASRFYKYIFHAVCLLFMVGIFILHVNGLESANLELLAIGFLGVILGHVPLEMINRFIGHPYALVSTYLCYTIAITAWDVVYPLLVVGTCLTVLVIYVLGAGTGEPGKARRLIDLLGKYSLFGYIAQIAVLQFLYRGLRYVDLGSGALGISFLGAFALTVMSVAALHRARAKSATVDGLYRAVFA